MYKFYGAFWIDSCTMTPSIPSIATLQTEMSEHASREVSVTDNIFVIGAVINSIEKGNSAPIQVQVMDAIKCFDKLWLQACINALYKAGLDNDKWPCVN